MTTPGQRAYEGYWGERTWPSRRNWQDLRPGEQQRWDAAAQAVLDAHHAQIEAELGQWQHWQEDTR